MLTLLSFASVLLFGALGLACVFIFIKAAVKAGLREHEAEKALEHKN